MDLQEKKPSGFDDFAGDYEKLIRDPIRETFATSSRFFFQRKIEVIRRFFRRAGIASEKLDWLDIGCGQGDLLRVGVPYFRSATGCDPSKGMLEACKDLQVREQEFLKKLPFDDASFDFLTAVCVYHHVPQQERQQLTEEALRVLRPSGIFCIIEHNPWNVMTRIIVSRTPVDADAHLLSARKSRRLLSAAGTKILTTRYFLLFPEALHSYFGVIEQSVASIPLGGQYSVFAQKVPRRR